VLLVGEAPDVAGQGENLRGGQEPAALDLSQGRAARGDRRAQLFLQLFDGRLVALEVAHDVAGDLLALVIGRSDGADLGQQGRGFGAVETEPGSAGVQVAEQDVQAVDPTGVLGDQIVAPLGEQPHDRGVVLEADAV